MLNITFQRIDNQAYPVYDIMLGQVKIGSIRNTSPNFFQTRVEIGSDHFFHPGSEEDVEGEVETFINKTLMGFGFPSQTFDIIWNEKYD